MIPTVHINELRKDVFAAQDNDAAAETVLIATARCIVDHRQRNAPPDVIEALLAVLDRAVGVHRRTTDKLLAAREALIAANQVRVLG